MNINAEKYVGNKRIGVYEVVRMSKTQNVVVQIK